MLLRKNLEEEKKEEHKMFLEMVEKYKKEIMNKFGLSLRETEAYILSAIQDKILLMSQQEK